MLFPRFWLAIHSLFVLFVQKISVATPRNDDISSAACKTCKSETFTHCYHEYLKLYCMFLERSAGIVCKCKDGNCVCLFLLHRSPGSDGEFEQEHVKVPFALYTDVGRIMRNETS